jgi:hypothetical protein
MESHTTFHLGSKIQNPDTMRWGNVPRVREWVISRKRTYFATQLMCSKHLNQGRNKMSELEDLNKKIEGHMTFYLESNNQTPHNSQLSDGI